MVITKINKDVLSLSALLYTDAVYPYKEQIEIFDKGAAYELHVPDEVSVVFGVLVEELAGLSGDYASLQGEITSNMGKDMANAIQELLDNTAQAYRYDDIKSVRSYTGFTGPFQEECTILAQWASACWVHAGVVESDVLQGIRAMPTIDEVLAELPQLVI